MKYFVLGVLCLIVSHTYGQMNLVVTEHAVGHYTMDRKAIMEPPTPMKNVNFFIDKGLVLVKSGDEITARIRLIEKTNDYQHKDESFISYNAVQDKSLKCSFSLSIRAKKTYITVYYPSTNYIHVYTNSTLHFAKK